MFDDNWEINWGRDEANDDGQNKITFSSDSTQKKRRDCFPELNEGFLLIEIQ